MMRLTNRSRPRVVELGAIVAVIAIPIALIVATWQPLEPLPRASRANPIVQEGPGRGTASPDNASDSKVTENRQATPASQQGQS